MCRRPKVYKSTTVTVTWNSAVIARRLQTLITALCLYQNQTKQSRISCDAPAFDDISITHAPSRKQHSRRNFPASMGYL